MLSSHEKRVFVPPPVPPYVTTQQDTSPWQTPRAARVRFLIFAVAVVVLLANYGHGIVLTVNINSSTAATDCDAAATLRSAGFEDWDKVCHCL